MSRDDGERSHMIKTEYKLTWGFHRGTILSRDDGEPYMFESEAEALAKIEPSTA